MLLEYYYLKYIININILILFLKNIYMQEKNGRRDINENHKNLYININQDVSHNPKKKIQTILASQKKKSKWHIIQTTKIQMEKSK